MCNCTSVLSSLPLPPSSLLPPPFSSHSLPPFLTRPFSLTILPPLTNPSPKSKISPPKPPHLPHLPLIQNPLKTLRNTHLNTKQPHHPPRPDLRILPLMQKSRERRPGNRDSDISLDFDFILGYRVGKMGFVRADCAGIPRYSRRTSPGIRERP
jgi:hypothetical protein